MVIILYLAVLSLVIMVVAAVIALVLDFTFESRRGIAVLRRDPSRTTTISDWELGIAAVRTADDDRAWAVVPPDRLRRILLVSEGDPYLETALTYLPNTELYGVSPADYGASTHPEIFDLVIFAALFGALFVSVGAASFAAGSFVEDARLRCSILMSVTSSLVSSERWPWRLR